MYDSILLSGLSDIPGITIVYPDSKIPEDQAAIYDEIQSRRETSESTLQNDVSISNTVSSDQFISISLCCTIIICCFLLISRR